MERDPNIGSSHPDRRSVLRILGGCAAHLALLGAVPGGASRFAATGRRPVVAVEPWGRIEEVGPGVWALISTPLEDGTTLCNGGIIAGSDGVVLVEAVATLRGATWLAGQARELTGRWPDAVILTHHHGDHTGGAAAFSEPDGAALRATARCRDRTREVALEREVPDRALLAALDRVTILPEQPETLDLGGRHITLVPRGGHTSSDVTVEVDDPRIVFCGDLVWNGMFPNFVNAIPSRLTRSVRALPDDAALWVPGHGTLADAGDLALYTGLLEAVEAHARDAVAAGWDAAEAAGRLELPGATREWLLFSPRYPERALDAWIRELTSQGGRPWMR